jgi:FlaA1/EpsC-like NDP-sugar epimerase
MICPIIVVPVILGSALLVLGLNAKAAVLKIDSHFHVSPWFLGAWMGVTVLIDVFITVMMSWALYRKRTGFKRTDSMIMTLMAYTINSGFLVTVLGTGMTISFAVAPGSLIWVAFSFVMSKCYINSLLAMLNSRDYVRNRSTTTTDKRDSAHNVSSLRIGSSSDAFGTKSRPGVTVTLHRSSASDFERRNSEHAIEPTFEDPKPV